MKSSSSATCFGIVTLLLVTLLTGGLAWRCAPNRLSWSHERGESLADRIQDAGFEVLTFEALQALMAGTEPVLLLDARDPVLYDEEGQLPGAFSLPIRAFEAVFPEFAPILRPASPLVTYCSGPECDEALLLAERLREAGQENVKVFLGGWEVWVREVGP